jgi:hypothetical protein
MNIKRLQLQPFLFECFIPLLAHATGMSLITDTRTTVKPPTWAAAHIPHHFPKALRLHSFEIGSTQRHLYHS